jgi:hypothetical protein
MVKILVFLLGLLLVFPKKIDRNIVFLCVKNSEYSRKSQKIGIITSAPGFRISRHWRFQVWGQSCDLWIYNYNATVVVGEGKML